MQKLHNEIYAHHKCTCPLVLTKFSQSSLQYLDEKLVLEKYPTKTTIKMLGVVHGLNESSVHNLSHSLWADVWKCRRWHDMGEIET